MSTSAPTVDEAITLAKKSKADRMNRHPSWPASIAEVLAAEVEQLRAENERLKKALRQEGVRP